MQGTYQWKQISGTGKPEFAYSISGDTGKIDFNTGKKVTSSDNKLELILSQQVLYDKVKINAGAIDGSPVFSSIQIEKLEINTGASDIELRFGDTGGKT